MVCKNESKFRSNAQEKDMHHCLKSIVCNEFTKSRLGRELQRDRARDKRKKELNGTEISYKLHRIESSTFPESAR